MELVPFRGLMFCSIKNGADDVIHKIVILQYFICKYENEFIKNKEGTANINDYYTNHLTTKSLIYKFLALIDFCILTHPTP